MIDGSLAAHLCALFGDSDDWAVVGGNAANLYRRDARATVDTDVLVSLGRRTMQDIRDFLAREGWAVRSMPEGDWLLRVVRPNAPGSVPLASPSTVHRGEYFGR